MAVVWETNTNFMIPTLIPFYVCHEIDVLISIGLLRMPF